MAEVVYTVRITLPEAGLAEEMIAWLGDGHIGEVVAGGARDAEIVRLDQPEHALEVRYHFGSREAFDRYEREFAPRLRAEGLRRFPLERGVVYSRSVGVVIGVLVAGGADQEPEKPGP